MGIEAYRAAQLRKAIHSGQSYKTDAQIILEIVKDAGTLKREEIIEAFYRKTGIDRDLAGQAVSTALTTMVKKGEITRVKPGYYKV